MGERLKLWLLKTVRRLPFVKARIAAEVAKAARDIEHTIHGPDKLLDFHKYLPDKGLSQVPGEFTGRPDTRVPTGTQGSTTHTRHRGILPPQPDFPAPQRPPHQGVREYPASTISGRLYPMTAPGLSATVFARYARRDRWRPLGALSAPPARERGVRQKHKLMTGEAVDEEVVSSGGPCDDGGGSTITDLEGRATAGGRRGSWDPGNLAVLACSDAMNVLWSISCLSLFLPSLFLPLSSSSLHHAISPR
jgi:hypothetical protein